MKKIILLLFTLLSNISYAETAFNIYGISIHSKSGFNEINPGIGIEHRLNPDWSIIGGTYKNSINNQSVYAGAKYNLLEYQHVRLNLQGGLITGYGTSENKNKIFPMIVPEVCLNISKKSPGVCAVLIPPISNVVGTIGVYLHVPIN